MGVDEHTTELGQQPLHLRVAAVPPERVTEAPMPLYLHGVPTSSADWTSVLSVTGGVAPDLQGFGRSGKGAHLDYTLTGYADWLATVLASDAIRALHPGAERPLALVGHGWGATVALAFACANPGRVERLLLINAVAPLPDFRWPAPLARLRRPLLGELLLGASTQRNLRRLLRAGTVNPEQVWPEDRVAEVWSDFDVGTQRAILRLHRAADQRELARIGEQLPHLRAPTLVLHGARDPWIAPDLAHRLAERIPGAASEVVERAGHWPWLDRPDTVARIAAFLA